jgi:hypothetical protein
MDEKNSWSIYLIGVAVLGIIAGMVVISVARLSNRELALIAIIMTLLSIGAGYLLCSYFTSGENKRLIDENKKLAQDELKLYGSKVAERVVNLSKELDRFAGFLTEELQQEYKDTAEGYRIRTERLESSVHILKTFKSINEALLGDWRNVIAEKADQSKG